MEGLILTFRQHNIMYGLKDADVKLPTTKYAIHKVLGTEDPHVYEHHICGGKARCCKPFPQLQPAKYAAHKYDVCACCRGRRFDVSLPGHGPEVITPRYVVFYLRLRDCVEQLFTDPVYCEGRRRVDRSVRDAGGAGGAAGGAAGAGAGGATGAGAGPGGGSAASQQTPEQERSYWASEYWRRIVGHDADLAHGDNMPIQVGSDGFLPYIKNKKYSLYVVYMRPTDLPLELRYQQRFVMPLMIFAGPTKPPLHSGMALLWDELGLLFKDGMTVTPTDRAPHRCRVFLTHVMGDSPALAAVLNTRGHGGYFPCPFCMIYGTYIEGAMRFLGWHEAVKVENTQWGKLPPPIGYVPPGQPPPVQPEQYWDRRTEWVRVFADAKDAEKHPRVISAPRYTHEEAMRCHSAAEGDMGPHGDKDVRQETKRASGPLPGARPRESLTR
jgi:hypothetical protein